MSSVHLLAGLARRLNREAGAPTLPSLYFFTDPARTYDPVRVAKRLPRGTAVVYRHFGASERTRIARRLAHVCRARGLVLLMAGDPELAARVGADGVHWPEQRLPTQRDARPWLVTVAAHSAPAVSRAEAFGADACFLAPVLPTRSSSGRRPLGLFRSSQIARAARLPTIALGGINARTARLLTGRGFAGVAAVDALSFA
ncbi:MAG TPA: thiamine phosphate synthase [Candidatus Binatia bacterium]|nr:thiamine phosphate synthase [Candidatus Binatia bacterium]